MLMKAKLSPTPCVNMKINTEYSKLETNNYSSSSDVSQICVSSFSAGCPDLAIFRRKGSVLDGRVWSLAVSNPSTNRAPNHV